MQTYRVIGIESSPYAVKVRAVLRYRRIPFLWVARMPQFLDETAGVKPLLMPVVQFPDGEYRTDSTPIIRDLDKLHDPHRRVVPDDPAQAFVSDLIEDFADEWLTKCLFNYRFSREADQLSGAGWVMDDAYPDIDHEALEVRTRAFIERQVARMPTVGCTPHNTPVLESSYLEVLEIMESFAAGNCYLFGSRPSLADFGLYGQLSTLSNDPTAMDIMRSRAPRTWHWVLRLADASGVDGSWAALTATAPATALLELAGRYYLPYLRANAQAIGNGEREFELELDGRPFRQAVFRYHRKCFDYLCNRWRALERDERLGELLDRTGCLEPLQSGAQAA